jgi:hypothetical protein
LATSSANLPQDHQLQNNLTLEQAFNPSLLAGVASTHAQVIGGLNSSTAIYHANNPRIAAHAPNIQI